MVLAYFLEELIGSEYSNRIATLEDSSTIFQNTKKARKSNTYQNLPANIQSLIKDKINLINKRKGLHESLLQFPMNNDNEEINETRKNIGYEIDLCTNQIDELVSQIECFETTGKMQIVEVKANEETINKDFSCCCFLG